MTLVTGDWLRAPETQRIMALLEAGGHRALAVGGCVRNALLGVAVADVDISTDAPPETVMALAKEAGLKAVPTGIDHGTVTVVVAGVPFEITTFRADIETDGRRAVVRFTDRVEEDAVRRDFTMNALYADRHGGLVDPLNGLTDLRARRIRFIEDADRRIREDYLRILRFFRFFAWYGDPAEGMDANALAAISDNLDGLSALSKERVGTEMLKILAAPDPLMAVSVMAQTGVLGMLLPGCSVRALGPLLAHEAVLESAPDPLRRLAALGATSAADLRLSKKKIDRLEAYQRLLQDMVSLPEIAWRHGAERALDVALLRAALFETPLPKDLRSTVAHAAQAIFPVSARDLMPTYQGAALGTALTALEHRWIASGFAMDKPTLLASLGNK